MSIPWLIGNIDDFRERPEPMGRLEAVLLFICVVAGMVAIGVLTLGAWLLSPLRRFCR